MAALASIASNPARAADPAPLQPVFLAEPDAGETPARTRFLEACRARRLPEPVIVALTGVTTPGASPALRAGQRHLDRLEYQEATRALDQAASDAALTGAAGLDTAELADIHLYRALARQKLGGAEGARAWGDLLRAAALAPERVLDEGRFPPTVRDSWRRALAEHQRRPRGTLTVRAPAGARITLDGRPPVHPPAVFPGLSYGEHHLRVEESGRVPWATVLSLSEARLELDVPERAALDLDDAVAAGHGQRRGVAFVLVARPREALVELRLIDSERATRTGEAVVALEVAGALEAAVVSLEGRAHERLRTAAAPAAAIAAPAPLPVRTRSLSWVTWGAVGTAVLLGGALAWQLSRGGERSEGRGFSVTVDTSRLGR